MEKEEFLEKLREIKSPIKKQEFVESVLKKIEKENNTEFLVLVLVTLADIYSEKRWFSSASQLYKKAAMLAKTFREKISFWLMAGLNALEAFNYKEAEEFFKNAIKLETTNKKGIINDKAVEWWFDHSLKLEKEKQYRRAISSWRHLLCSGLEFDKGMVSEKIASLYEKIGMPGDARKLRENFKK